MNMILLINQSVIGTLPMAILTCVRKVMQLYIVKVWRLVISCYSEPF